MPADKQKWPTTLLLILVLLSSIHAYFAIKGTLPIATGYQDTQIFVKAAQQLKATGELYTLKEPLAKTYAPARAVYKFPPTYVLAYLPWLDTFANSANNYAYHILFAIHILRYLIAMFLVAYFLGPRNNRIWQLSVIALFLLASPVYESLYGMTFENLFFFMLVTSLVLIKFKREWPIVIMLSYAALAKIYPAAQLLFFATKQRWKFLLIAACATVSWLGISLYFIGADAFRVYIDLILPIILNEQVMKGGGNASPFYTFLPPGILQNTVVYSTVLITFAIINLKNSRKNDENNFFSYCLVIALGLLLIPNCWVQYQIILLLPIAVLIGSALTNNSRYRRFKITIALLACIPMIASENYSELNLPYYDKPFIRHHLPIAIAEAIIYLARIFSALLVWIGLGTLLLLENHGDKNEVR